MPRGEEAEGVQKKKCGAAGQSYFHALQENDDDEEPPPPARPSVPKPGNNNVLPEQVFVDDYFKFQFYSIKTIFLSS